MDTCPGQENGARWSEAAQARDALGGHSKVGAGLCAEEVTLTLCWAVLCCVHMTCTSRTPHRPSLITKLVQVVRRKLAFLENFYDWTLPGIRDKPGAGS